jgi:hypothetical protein
VPHVVSVAPMLLTYRLISHIYRVGPQSVHHGKTPSLAIYCSVALTMVNVPLRRSILFIRCLREIRLTAKRAPHAIVRSAKSRNSEGLELEAEHRAIYAHRYPPVPLDHRRRI